MVVGFGPHKYCLPLQLAGMELVKLADFGTSAVGAGGLGEPITVQQVGVNTTGQYLILYYIILY